MKLTIKDTFCYKHAEIDFAVPGLTLLHGENRAGDYSDSNGTGKTALLRSLTFALFGTWHGMRDIKGVVRQGTDAAVLRVEFTTPSGDTCVVTRRVTKSVHKVTLHFGGKEVQTDVVSAQAHVENALGVTAQVWQELLHYDGSTNFTALTDAKLKAILVGMLPLNFSLGEDAFADDAKKADQAVAKSQGVLTSLRGQQQQLEDEIRRLQQDAQGWEKTRTQQASGTEARLAAAEQHLKEKQDEYQRAQDAARDDQTSAYHQAVTAQRAAVTSKQHSLQTLLADIKREDAHAMEAAPTTTCGTCQQPLPAAKQQELHAAWQARVAAHIARGQELRATYENIRLVELPALEQQLQTCQVQMEQYAQSRKALVESAQLVYARLADARSACESLRKELRQQQEAQVNPYSAGIERNTTALNGCVSLQTQHAADAAAAQREGAIARWLRHACGRSGLTHWVLSRMLPVLNHYVSKILRQLSAADMTAEFAIVGQQITLTGGIATGGNDLRRLSSGERRRIEAAVFLALREVFHQMTATGCGLIFLDELLDNGLDTLGQQSLLEAIATYAREAQRCIILVSNDPRVLGDRRQVDRVLVAVKTEDGSHVEIR